MLGSFLYTPRRCVLFAALWLVDVVNISPSGRWGAGGAREGGKICTKVLRTMIPTDWYCIVKYGIKPTACAAGCDYITFLQGKQVSNGQCRLLQVIWLFYLLATTLDFLWKELVEKGGQGEKQHRCALRFLFFSWRVGRKNSLGCFTIFFFFFGCLFVFVLTGNPASNLDNNRPPTVSTEQSGCNIISDVNS